MITQSLGAATLSYDAASRLSKTIINGTETQLLYDGTNLVAEYDSTGTLLKRYVHSNGVDEPIVVYNDATTTNKNWLFADHLGSIVALANTTGAATANYTYSAEGKQGGSTVSRFGYTGQQNLSGLGVQYYKARMYSADLGRFIQTDPIGMADDMNLYTYVGNNAVNRSDPSGRAQVAQRNGFSGGSIQVAGTLQIGLAGSATIGGFIVPQVGFGVAFDTFGNIGIYGYVGGGGGVGINADIGISVQKSNARTINDLSGRFNNASYHFGEGAGGSIDVFNGASDHGYVTGGGVTGGLSIGAAGSVTTTNTQICGTIGCAGPVSNFLSSHGM